MSTNRCLLPLLALLLVSAVCAGGEGDAPPLFPVSVKGKMGYIDRTGRIIIPPRFGYAYPFSEELAVVVDENEKYGFVDRAGTIVVPYRYAEAQPFSDGVAWVRVTKQQEIRWTAIDTQGRELFEPRPYVAVFGFQDGIGHVDTGNDMILVDKKGTPLYADWGEYFLRPSEGLVGFRSRDKSMWGFLDRGGKIMIPPRFSDADPFSGGLAAVRIGGEVAPHPKDPSVHLLQGGTIALIDRTGKVVYSVAASHADDRMSSMKEGRACLAKDGKSGYLDESGKMVIPCQYEMALDFNEGRAAVKQGGKWGFIDRDGRVVVPFRYEGVDSFHEGMARVWKYGKPSLAGYVNAEGQETVPPAYQGAQFAFCHGLAQVWLGPGRGNGYVNKSGQLIWQDVMPEPETNGKK